MITYLAITATNSISAICIHCNTYRYSELAKQLLIYFLKELRLHGLVQVRVKINFFNTQIYLYETDGYGSCCSMHALLAILLVGYSFFFCKTRRRPDI